MEQSTIIAPVKLYDPCVLLSVMLSIVRLNLRIKMNTKKVMEIVLFYCTKIVMLPTHSGIKETKSVP